MGKVELHFFHGFLGSPRDWDETLSYLSSDYSVTCHDLLKDSLQCGDRDQFFTDWTRYKEGELSVGQEDKVLIGYSLGGRLLLNLDHRLYNKIILLASHPGLYEGREERESSDRGWVEKMSKMKWDDWLSAWNNQDVFSSDKKRPDRSGDKMQKGQWARILQGWSLAYQPVMDEHMKNHSDKIYWGCGSQDLKFKGLKERMAKSLSSTHLFEVENSGHGILFDQPQALANKIVEIVENA